MSLEPMGSNVQALLSRDPSQEYQYGTDLAGSSRVLTAFPRFIFNNRTLNIGTNGAPETFQCALVCHQIFVGWSYLQSGSGVDATQNLLKVELTKTIEFRQYDTETTYVTPLSVFRHGNDASGRTYARTLPAKGVQYVRVSVVDSLLVPISTWTAIQLRAPFSVRIYGE